MRAIQNIIFIIILPATWKTEHVLKHSIPKQSLHLFKMQVEFATVNKVEQT